MASTCLNLIFDISVIYIFLVSLFTSIVEKSTTTFYGFYYIFIVCICAVWCSLEIKRNIFSKFKISNPSTKNIFISLLVIISFIMLYWHARGAYFFTMEIWVDEIIQALSLGLRPIWDITHTAAYQQQPPTDYFLSRFGIMLFGKSEFGVRFHAIFFGILSSCFFILAINKFKLPLWLQIPFICSFLYQPMLVNYASQARPVSLAIYFLIYLIALSLNSEDKSEVNSRRLVVAFIMLLLSIGLQPIIACVSLIPMMYLSDLNIQNKPSKNYIKYFIYSMIVTSPIMINIYNESKRANQFYDVNYLSAALTSLSNTTVQKIMFYFKVFDQTEILWLLPLLLIIFLCMLKLFREINIKPLVGPTLGWFLFHFIFVIIFLSLWSIINWPLLPRYFILLFVGGILLSAYVAGIIFRFTHSKSLHFFKYIVFVLISVGTLQILVFYIPSRAENIIKQSKNHARMRDIYKAASANSVSELFIPLPYVLVGSESSISGSKSSAGIYMQNKQDSVFSNCFTKSGLDAYLLLFRPFQRKLNTVNPQALVLFIDVTIPEVLPLEVQKRLLQFNPYKSYGEYPDIISFNVPVQNDINSTIENALLTFVDIDPKGEQNFFLLESLIDYYINKGRIKEAKKMLLRIKNLNYRDKMTNDINYYLYNGEVNGIIQDFEKKLLSINDNTK